MIGQDPYYDRPEVSNSSLGDLMAFFMNKEQLYDLQAAYRFGNLIDAMITEPHRCDHLRYRIDGEQFTREEWDKSKRMRKAFLEHPLCRNLQEQSEGQMVMAKNMDFMYKGIPFSLKVRCKWDLFMPALQWGGDIKSTTATTQDQFVKAITYFNYDRQRAFYMDIAGSQKDVLIGISKENFKVFVVTITRDHELYLSGKEKYSEAAFRYWTLFDGFFDDPREELSHNAPGVFSDNYQS